MTMTMSYIYGEVLKQMGCLFCESPTQLTTLVLDGNKLVILVEFGYRAQLRPRQNARLFNFILIYFKKRNLILFVQL